MTDEVNILGELLTLGPVVTILVWIIYRQQTDIKALRKELKRLNEELREVDRSTLTVTKDLNQTLKELIASIKT